MNPVQPAHLARSRSHIHSGGFHVTELFFEVPENYAHPEDGTIRLFARSIKRPEKMIPGISKPEDEPRKPYLVYLEGGPGFAGPEPRGHPVTNRALDAGYTVLYVDYRGTGMSNHIHTDLVLNQGDVNLQVEYLKLFRADSIVRDLEAIRLCLTKSWELEYQKWSIFGQSFGGFVCLSYLSKYPQGLREVFMTGGLAPVKRQPTEVYSALYKKVIERNEAYYAKYPEDEENVLRIARYLTMEEDGFPLPGGGRFTIHRLLGLGMGFGCHGGLDGVHNLILKLISDLDQFNYFTTPTLMALEREVPFDTNPVYAILHESIYCSKGVASNWAALEAARKYDEFINLTKPLHLSMSLPLHGKQRLYFSGEMVYPCFFDTYPTLQPLKPAAEALAKHSGWAEDLYDEEQLRRNEVPVYAVSYIDDMYVDIEAARETAALVKGIKVHETNQLHHNAIRAKGEEVLGMLFRLRDDTLD
ncbi:Alpha/Beta hydrolase protein [Triangularia verruculosa]|uniref:Alpha/Beta hydrolase protein n=1 Tax=Triangularia verruculosa TaxID=2587418 RepID=A0AAN6XVI5_9PEZI|nr:Alpha/Beta hydrolase protein [Triangularia verruculosa]